MHKKLLSEWSKSIIRHRVKSSEIAKSLTRQGLREVQLNNGYVALVDEEDFDRVNKFKWTARKSHGNIYACRKNMKTQTFVQMHNFIMNFVPTNGTLLDHRNRNGLHNYKSNLRVATHQQNNCNRRPITESGYKGVVMTPVGNYAARIKIDGKTKHLGTFTSVVEAAVAYDKAAKKYFGEFAYLNFPLFGDFDPDVRPFEWPERDDPKLDVPETIQPMLFEEPITWD